MSEHPAHPDRADQFLLHGNLVHHHTLDLVIAEFAPIPTGSSRVRRIAIGMAMCALAFAATTWIASSGSPVPKPLIIAALLATIISPLFVLYFNPPRASFAMIGSTRATGTPPQLLAEIEDTIQPARDIRSLRVHARGNLLGIIELAGISRGAAVRARVLDSNGALRLEGHASGTARHLGAGVLLEGVKGVLNAIGSSREPIERAVVQRGIQTWAFHQPNSQEQQIRLNVPPAASFASVIMMPRELSEEERMLMIVCGWAISRR